MELRDYAIAARRRWRWITTFGVGGLISGLAVGFLSAPEYVATTRVFFAVQSRDSITDLAQGSSFAERQMSSLSEVARSPLVLDAVADGLELGEDGESLAARVSVDVPLDTVILKVAVSSSDATDAARVANAISDQLHVVVSELYPARADGSEVVRATTLSRATVPVAPASPPPLTSGLVGLAAGLVTGLVMAVLRETLDTRVRAERDLPDADGTPLLTAVPFDSDAPKSPIAFSEGVGGIRSESIRRLRTNLRFVQTAKRASGSVAITSSIPGEGKTATAVNLALSLADANLRVVLVDADLRRPSVGRVMGLEQASGLTSALIGAAPAEVLTQPYRNTRLDVLTSGIVPPNPSELLASSEMDAILRSLEQKYDCVIVDSAPLLPVTDGAIVSSLCSGVILVVGAGKVRTGQVRASMHALKAVGADVYGVVLNRVLRRDEEGYTSYSSYAYSGTSDPGEQLPPRRRDRRQLQKETRAPGRRAMRSRLDERPERSERDGDVVEGLALSAEPRSTDPIS